MLVTDQSTAPHGSPSLDHLQHAIEHAAEFLPAQGPITVFVHHNTLHAFEDLPFEEAVCEGGSIFGCLPYLPEERYRQMLARGRFRSEDLRAVLREKLQSRADEPIFSLATRLELRMAMLEYPLHSGSDQELRWFVAETEALDRFRADIPAERRERCLEQTRHWIMRDLRNLKPGDPRSAQQVAGHQAKSPSSERDRHIRAALAALFERVGEASIED